jgi:hypothetical protein
MSDNKTKTPLSLLISFLHMWIKFRFKFCERVDKYLVSSNFFFAQTSRRNRVVSRKLSWKQPLLAVLFRSLANDSHHSPSPPITVLESRGGWEV